MLAAGSAAPTRATSRIAPTPASGAGDEVDGDLDPAGADAGGGRRLGGAADGQHVGAEPGVEQDDVGQHGDDGGDDDGPAEDADAVGGQLEQEPVDDRVGLPSEMISASAGGGRQRAQRDDEVGDAGLARSSSPLTQSDRGAGRDRDEAAQPDGPRPCAERRPKHDGAQGHRRGDGQVDAGGGDDERLTDGQDDQDGGGTSIASMLPVVRKVGLTIWKITHEDDQADSAAQSAQNARRWPARARHGRSRRRAVVRWLALVVCRALDPDGGSWSVSMVRAATAAWRTVTAARSASGSS